MTRSSVRSVPAREDARLPWLADRPQQKVPDKTIALAAALAVILVLVAAASYWAGLNSIAPRMPQGVDKTAEISVSVPEARPVAEAPANDHPDRPDEPPSSTAPIAAERSIAPVPAPRHDKRTSPPRSSSSATKPPPAADEYPLWPTSKVEGANGRLVRIGSFDSEKAAREAWNKILAEYPGMTRLKPLVVDGKSLRDGHTFYRLQVGTSSQAHSAVLCDRSRGLGLGCSVIGPIMSDTPSSPERW